MNKNWSEHETRVLISMRRQDIPHSEIAATLGRTTESVMSKASSLKTTINKAPDPVAPVYAPRPGLSRAERLTQAFCNDPPLGRSALDQRVMG